jgi:hypothetical protein
MKQERNGRERFWRRHLSAWKRSGLTQREYCKRQGVSEWSFSLWKRRLARSTTSGVSFVPVTVTGSTTGIVGLPGAHRQPLTLVVGSRYRLEVGDGFSDETLSRLLCVLGRS